MMARPRPSAPGTFTTGEIARAALLTPRNLALLIDNDLAPTALKRHDTGKAGNRTYDSAGFAHAALIGAFHIAGFELLVAGRLAHAFADEYGARHGKLSSNLSSMVRGGKNGSVAWGKTPDEAGLDLGQDFWIHRLLVTRSSAYRRDRTLRGDLIAEIADHTFVLTHYHDMIKTFSPVSPEGLWASPEFRIVGRGSSTFIVPAHEEITDFDFHENPAAAARLKALEQEYISGARDAVVTVRINISLAIRSAFDRHHESQITDTRSDNTSQLLIASA